MYTTESGIEMEMRLRQPLNALTPIVVTDVGRVKEVRPWHWANVYLPMLATLDGIVMEASLVHPDNTWSSIMSIDLGSSRKVREVQPLKASRPIFLTEFGIEREVSALQFLKACDPMLVKVLGSSTVWRTDGGVFFCIFPHLATGCLLFPG